MPKLTIDIPPFEYGLFQDACRAQDETPGAVVREMIHRFCRRQQETRRRTAARRHDVLDERLLARLRLLVAEALCEAATWAEAQVAMRQRGLLFHPSGGGLVVIDAETGEVLAKGSAVGPAYVSLVRRFRGPIPGHPRPGIGARALAGS
jgi:hypothetical protein